MKILNIHKQFTLMLFLSILSISLVYADAYSDGEKFFKENKPEQAIPFFEQALLMENVSPNVYNFLGLSYYQIGKYQQSLDAFLKGTTKDGTNKRILYYNAGNTAFAMGNYSIADQYFSIAFAADSNFSSALLNRANTKMKLDQLQNAMRIQKESEESNEKKGFASILVDLGLVTRDDTDNILLIKQLYPFHCQASRRTASISTY